MLKKKHIPIGSEVEFTRSIYAYHDSTGNRCLGVFVFTPQRGVVTGISMKFEGAIDRDYEYGSTFIPTKGIRIVLVRTSLNGKEICVDPSSIKVIKRVQEPEWFNYNNVTAWTVRDRKISSDLAKITPREKNGRFKATCDWTEEERHDYFTKVDQYWKETYPNLFS